LTTTSFNRRKRLVSYGVTMALLVCLSVTTIAQAAHFHKDGRNSDPACAVCALQHAPALTGTAIHLPPPQEVVRVVSLDGDVSHHTVATPTIFIRPPPLG